MSKAQAIIVMGVSGCGKSSVGRGLSRALGWPFYDGDNYHPQANLDKMARGIPLTDADRQPWLEALHNLIVENLSEGRSLILACSALKESYRRILQGGRTDVRFVHLEGSFELIQARMQQRSGHYMKAGMLRSQFEALEPPKEAFVFSIEPPVSEIVDKIVATMID
ncbi:MAG: gluconokinase [Anaerolineales bacterium]|nr:gluconokinase [Anaerolineales bacterium]